MGQISTRSETFSLKLKNFCDLPHTLLQRVPHYESDLIQNEKNLVKPILEDISQENSIFRPKFDLLTWFPYIRYNKKPLLVVKFMQKK